MKTYTENDLLTFERDEYGRLICPKGDYTQLKRFGDYCSFGEYCSFSDYCSFGKGCIFSEYCSFGKGCSFGDYCIFGKYCSFGKGCSFGKYCSFGKGCSFGDYCSFGEYCSFSDYCSFGEYCSFSDYCSFGKGCEFENGHKARAGYPFMAFVGAGSRVGSKVYFINCEDGIIVRCGCWCSNIDKFRQRVKYGDADPLYLDFADLAEKRFSEINGR